MHLCLFQLNTPLSRLPHFIIGCLMFIAAGAASSQPVTPVLRVLAWPGYAAPEVVEAFEKQHRVHVELTLVGSDEALWQKSSAKHGANFDVLAVNTVELQRFIDLDLIQAVDAAAIPNIRRQLQRFRSPGAIPGLWRNNKQYGVPFTYAEMGLIYDRDQFPTPPDSIDVLWDPRYRGRVIAYNTASHNFSLAAIATGGKSPFRISPDAWPSMAEKLIALRRNVLTFYTLPDESVELFMQQGAAVMFANYGMQQVQLLKAAGANIGYAIPKEGALAWLDCWAITTKTRNLPLANAWIDHMLDEKTGRLLVSHQGLANTTAMPSGNSSDDKLIWLEPVENIPRRQMLWQRIVSGDNLNKVLLP